MALRRLACTASLAALCLAVSGSMVAVSASDEIGWPPLPPPAEVVINLADITPQASFDDPPRAEPGPDGLPTGLPPEMTIAAEPVPANADQDMANQAKVAATVLAVNEPVATTASIAVAAPLTAEEPTHDKIMVALPGAPDPAPTVIDPIVPGVEIPRDVIAEPVPAPTPRLADVATEDLAPLVARALVAAVRQSWLPDDDERDIIAFYEARQHRPLWFDNDGLNASGKQLQAQLARAAADGLRSGDYALPRLIMPRPTDLAVADVRLTTLAVRYARDARGARIDPRRLSALITPKLSLPGATEVLSKLTADGADAGQALAAFQPAHDGYRALRRRLAELQSQRGPVDPEAVSQVRIPHGPAIRVGMRDDRIALIRARFGFAPDEMRQHDRQLATVVAEFQRDRNLPANGVLNRATIDALNGGGAHSLEADLIAAMERWRWLPGDLGDEHLIVNVPEYKVRKVDAGRVIHQARVVVGKAERPTPIFSDMMDHLVINPSWTIPPTILRQDILPKLASDPGYAERRGFEVIRRGNNITVRQPPGPTNALGNVKFMFPNDHAVYLHDTPSRNLFGSARRAYSSGCVRVEQPLKLAELVLGGTENGWSERRLQSMVGSGERTIRLSKKLPIHIVYMTHVVDDAGVLTTYDDIYGFHRRTREALGL